MKQNTDKYLEKLKKLENQKPLLSKEQLRSLAGDGDDNDKSNNFTKSKGFKIMTVISTALIIALVGILSVNTPEQKEIADISKGNKFTLNENISEFDTKEEVKSEQSLKIQNGIPVIDLTPEEMDRLGIKRTDDGIEFARESLMELNYRNYRKIAEYHGYPADRDSLIIREIFRYPCDKGAEQYINYNGWDLSEPLNDKPLSIRIYGNWTTFKSQGFHPSLKKYAGRKFAIESDDIFKKLKKKNYDYSSFKEIRFDKSKYSIFPSIVMTRFIAKIDGDDFTVFLWFMPSKNFLKKLNDEHRELILANFDKKESISYEKTISVEKTGKPPKEINIAGINRLMLTEKELTEYGIMKTDSGYTFASEQYYFVKDFPEKRRELYKKQMAAFNYDVSADSGMIRSWTTLSKNSVKTAAPLEYTGWSMDDYNRIQPVAASAYYRGYHYDKKYKSWEKLSSSTSFYKSTKESPVLRNAMLNNQDIPDMDTGKSIGGFHDGKYYSKIKRVLPVCIIKGDSANLEETHEEYVEYYFWFYLNEEFVNKLPGRYRTPLAKELEYVELLESGQISAETACKGLADQESYLGICRFESPNIRDVNVYPNPGSGKNINLGFNLKSGCRIRISLHDLNGRYITDLLPATAAAKGKKRFDFTAKNIQEGLYLISITTDRGEQATVKYIIKK